MVATLLLGSSPVRGGGSSPLSPTMKIHLRVFFHIILQFVKSTFFCFFRALQSHFLMVLNLTSHIKGGIIYKYVNGRR